MENAPRNHALVCLLNKFNELLDYLNKEEVYKTNEIINRLHQYIQENIHDDLSLVKLGKVVYLSPQYLCRIYKQETRVRLIEYIADVRLTKSKRLLRCTQRS